MTLRERGFTSCGHPTQRVEPVFDPQRPPGPHGTAGLYRERVFCRHCGAERVAQNWQGGTLDFKEADVLDTWGSVRRWFDADGGAR